LGFLLAWREVPGIVMNRHRDVSTTAHGATPKQDATRSGKRSHA
jgi:hypothetical protein